MILLQVQAPPPPLPPPRARPQQSAVRFCFSDSVRVSKQPGLRFVCLPKVVKDMIVADDGYKVSYLFNFNVFQFNGCVLDNSVILR